jgi:cytochrome c-type biogenesis protein
MPAEASPDILLAFAAGLLSVLSPCVLPLLPAYLSLVSGLSVDEMREGDSDTELRRRVMHACLGFVCGFTLVFVVLGIGAVAIGRVVRTWRLALFGFEVGISQLAGVAILVLGLHMTGFTPIRALYRDTRFQFSGRGRRGTASAALVGAGFALGWSPCIGPILAAILALAGARETVLHGMGLLLVYSAGLAVPFLIAGWSIERFFHVFARVKRHFRALEVGSGLVLVGVGFLLVINRFTALNGPLAFLNDFIASAERALQ